MPMILYIADHDPPEVILEDDLPTGPSDCYWLIPGEPDDE